MARYKGTQASHLYEKSMHTLCTIQWATAPGRSLNYPRPKSITHLRTFSDNGVYVALQLFLVMWYLTSDAGYQYPNLIDRRLGSFNALGWFSRYTWDQGLYVVSEPRETLSNVESQVFAPYKFGSTAGDRTPDLLTTRPTCYLCIHRYSDTYISISMYPSVQWHIHQYIYVTFVTVTHTSVYLCNHRYSDTYISISI